MAVTSGVRQTLVWLEVNGQRFPCLQGSANQTATRQSATFSAHLAMSLPGVLDALKDLGENSAKLIVGLNQKTLVDGELDRADFDFIARTIQVSGRCKSAKLHQTKTAEKFNNKKPDEIVKDLAGRVGLELDAAASDSLAGKIWQIDHAKLTDNVSYASVIHKLAEMEGLRWWIKDGKLVMKADNDGAAYTVRYAAPAGQPVVCDAMQLRVSRNFIAARTGKVTVKSWNQKKKKVFQATAVIGGAGGTTNYQYHVPGLTQDHADKHAKSKAKDHARHEFTVSLSMVGDPDIDAAMKLRLQGTPFDQDFDMESISHSIGQGGHTMSISAKSAKKGREAKVEGGA
jgi:phage protein D